MIPAYLVRVCGANPENRKISGTGFIVSPAGHVATCLHVVREARGKADNVKVHIKGIEGPITYKLLACVEEDDLAILEPLPLNQPPQCAILNPNWVREKEQWDRMRFYGHSSHQNYWEGQRIPCPISGMDYESYRVGIIGSVNQGDSGGPVVDVNDRIVGIVAQRDRSRQGHARFIPVSALIELLQKQDIGYLTELGAKDALAQRQDRLLERYRTHLRRTAGRVKLFNKEHALEKVFVELSLVEEAEQPSRDAHSAGIADVELRRSREVFFDKAAGVKEQTGRRTLKPTELLRRDERTFIVGAPGCGKTTLLKYLVWKVLDDEQRLPVLCELKNITEETLTEAADNLVDVLFTKAVCDALHLDEGERDDFKELFHAKLRDGSLAIFLDGLDEVSGTAHFDRLCRSIAALDSSEYAGSIIVSSRPYAHRTLGGLRSMEVSPLTLRQIKSFLTHYLPDGGRAQQIYVTVQRRREMLELARVPFLLSVIAKVVEPEQEAIGERLSLYTLIVKRLIVEIDQDRGLKRFRVDDSDGSRKKTFLRMLAFERLLVDSVEGAMDRLVFDDEVLSEKARRFCLEEGLTDYRLFLTDVKHSPLLREVGTDTYAFTHLTLQEYLAAEGLRVSPERKEIFIRSYFDPVLAEMEVLPMAVGLMSNPDDYYQMVEELPDSINLVNLRLRARALAYVQTLSASHHSNLVSEITSLLFGHPYESVPFSDSVFRSLSAAKEIFLEPLLVRMESLFKHGHHDLRIRSAHALGLVGHERSVRLLARTVREEENLRAEAMKALKTIGGETVVDELLKLLRDKDPELRKAGLSALSDIGGDLAVERLLEFVCLPTIEEDDPAVESFMEALSRLGKSAMANQLLVGCEHMVDAEDGTAGMWLSLVLTMFHLEGRQGLSELLRQVKLRNERTLQELFLDALKNLNADKTAPKLLDALAGDAWLAREQAGLALTKLNDDCIVPGLIDIINTGGDWRDDRAAAMLAKMAKAGNARALEGLRSMLRSENERVRRLAASLLKAIDARQAGPELLEMFRTDPDGWVRSVAAGALHWKSYDDLMEMLQGSDAGSRMQVLGALARKSDDRVIPVLRQALRDDPNGGMGEMVAEALGKLKARSAVPELLSVLGQATEPSLKKTIIDALGEIASPRAFDALATALQEDTKELFQTVPQKAAAALGKLGDQRAIPKLVNALADERLRYSAALALGELKSEATVDALGHVLRSDRFGSREAATALQKIGGAHAASELLSAMTLVIDSDALKHVAEAINGIGDTTIAGGFVRNLSSEEESIRRSAVEHVGYYCRNEKVVEKLSVMVSDDSAAELQRTAKTALWKLSHLSKQIVQAGIEPDVAAEFEGKRGDFLSRCSLARTLSDHQAVAEIELETLGVITSALNHDEAHHNLAVMLAEQGRTEDAERGFRAWLECSPTSSGAHHGLGWFLASQDRSDEAKKEYLEAIRLQPDADGSHNNLGNLYFQEYSYDGAEKEFRESIRCNPEGALAHRNLGDLLVTLERPAEAETEFREACRIDAEDTEAFHRLGMLLGDLEKLDDAEAAYLQELKLNPNLPAALNNLGLIYERQGRLADAERSYREGIGCGPDLLQPHRNLKNLLVVNDREKEAEAALKTWIHLNETLNELHSDLGELLKGQGRVDEAIAVFREWVDCSPESTAAYGPLVKILVEQGRVIEAELACLDWIGRNPEDSSARYALWDLLIKQEKAVEALNDYRQWVALDEDHRWIKSSLVELLVQREFTKDAEDALLEHIQDSPEIFSPRADIANFYVQQGRDDDAERVYREWLTHHDDDGLAHYHLGILVAKSGRMSEAETHCLSALERFNSDQDKYLVDMLLVGVMETYSKLERYDEGETICREATKIRPDYALAHIACGSLQWYGGALTEALSSLGQAVELEPLNTDALNARGQVLAELGEHEAAVDDLRRVIEILGDKIWTINLAYAKNGLAFALAGRGDIEQAMKLFGESIDLEPENAWAYFNKALTYKRIGNDIEAKRNLTLSLEKTNPPLPPRLSKRAVALLRGDEASSLA